MDNIKKRISDNAKEMLRKNWGTAFVMVVVLIAVPQLIATLESIAAGIMGLAGLRELLFIYSSGNPNMQGKLLGAMLLAVGSLLMLMFMVFPLFLGFTDWCYSLSYGMEDEGVTQLFAFFESRHTVFKSTMLYFQLWLRKILWAALIHTPGFLILKISAQFTLGNPSDMDRIMSFTGSAIGAGLLGISSVAAWVFCKRYALAPCIMCANSKISVRQAIKQSIKASKGYCVGIALFQLSFVGWWLASLLVIPVFYTLPYITACNTLYARSLVQRAAAESHGE